MKTSLKISLLTLALMMLSATAEAHVSGAHGAGFVHGLAHPLSGADHLLAMVAVGLWGAQKGGKAVWAVPAAFMASMVLGGALGLIGLPLPIVELGIAASLMVLGSLVALSFQPPLGVGMALVSLFAIFHGYAHGAEMPEASSPLLYAAGFLLATGVLHAFGVASCLLAKQHASALAQRAVRSAGLAVAASGVMFAAM